MLWLQTSTLSQHDVVMLDTGDGLNLMLWLQTSTLSQHDVVMLVSSIQ
jgi:hypothetical protein